MVDKKKIAEDVEDADVVDDGAVDETESDTLADTDTSGDAPEEADSSADEPADPTLDDDYEFADPIVDDSSLQPTPEAEDVHTTSLAARVLQGLALIAVGIALALWGAPKIAPMLPSGLAPVAEFLTPGQTEAKAEIAALRQEMSDRLAALEARPSGDVSQESVAAALSAYDAQIQEDLASIRDRLAATDGQDIEARLAAVETKIEGITAELTAVSERLSRQITENGVALSEEAATKLAGYQAALEGLRAEVKALAAKNGALSQKVDEIANAAARRVEEAQQEASTRVATTATRRVLTEIDAALDSGAPFAAALAGLQEVAAVEPPAALAAVAETGTPSWTTLRNQFAALAHAAIREDAKANAGDGVGGKLGAFLRTQVGTRSLERREGDDVDAILSRVEDDLINRKLDAALAEAETLPEAAKAVMADWIANLRALTEARNALAELNDTLGASQ